jgi:hypothetical protein
MLPVCYSSSSLNSGALLSATCGQRAALILQSVMASRRNKDADSDALRSWRYLWSYYWMLILFWEREVFGLINHLDLHARD